MSRPIAKMTRPLSNKRFYSSARRHYRHAMREQRRERDNRNLHLMYDTADWDYCLRAFMDKPPVTLIHRGRKPSLNRRYTPWS